MEGNPKRADDSFWYRATSRVLKCLLYKLKLLRRNAVISNRWNFHAVCRCQFNVCSHLTKLIIVEKCIWQFKTANLPLVCSPCLSRMIGGLTILQPQTLAHQTLALLCSLPSTDAREIDGTETDPGGISPLPDSESMLQLPEIGRFPR